MKTNRSITVDVRCARDFNAVYKVPIEFALIDEKWLPLPCNGCDNLSGGDTCKKCCARLTFIFLDDPHMEHSEPISPSHPKVR